MVAQAVRDAITSSYGPRGGSILADTERSRPAPQSAPVELHLTDDTLPLTSALRPSRGVYFVFQGRCGVRTATPTNNGPSPSGVRFGNRRRNQPYFLRLKIRDESAKPH